MTGEGPANKIRSRGNMLPTNQEASHQGGGGRSCGSVIGRKRRGGLGGLGRRGVREAAWVVCASGDKAVAEVAEVAVAAAAAAAEQALNA